MRTTNLLLLLLQLLILLQHRGCSSFVPITTRSFQHQKSLLAGDPSWSRSSTRKDERRRRNPGSTWLSSSSLSTRRSIILSSSSSTSSGIIVSNDVEPSQETTTKTKRTVVVAGATGYIGRAVVQQSVAAGHETIALVRSLERVRSTEGHAQFGTSFDGATVLECNVEDEQSIQQILERTPIDTFVSCLASPSGTKKDVYAIDYQATLNCLNASRAAHARHFILLSAFCCRRPLLQLQQAKLQFEAALQAQSDLSYTIVRPTAFFKSVSGQLEAIQNGAPYVLFGDGAVTQCNPISEWELADYMLDSMDNPAKHNRILNIGGPDEPLTNQQLGELMFEAIGQEPKFVYVPTWIFDSIIQTLQVLATVFQSEALEDAAETGRIGKYYAVEDMLTTDPTEQYGTITMKQHYQAIASKGQDPFAPVRATAFIGRAFELFPLIPVILTSIWLMMHPRQVEQAVAQSDFHFMLASSPTTTASQHAADWGLFHPHPHWF